MARWPQADARGLVRPARSSLTPTSSSTGTIRPIRRLNFDPAEACQIIEALSVWNPIRIDLAILRRAWLVEERFRLSGWDALIVAAAQAAECAVLVTEDLQDGQPLDGLRVADPFASPERSPQQVLAAF